MCVTRTNSCRSEKQPLFVSLKYYTGPIIVNHMQRSFFHLSHFVSCSSNICEQIRLQYLVGSAGNNSRSPDIVRPNFENVPPILHYDWT